LSSSKRIPSREELPIVIIEPRTGWRGIDWKELREYQDLFFFLIWRNIKVRYAQSAIGVGWAVLQPVATMLVFTVIFGRLMGVESDGAPYAIFAFVALVPWTYFANCLTEGTASIVSNASMISKIYFPRLIMPLAVTGARMVDFFIALTILGVLLFAYRILPNLGVLMLPVLIIIMTLAASGLGMWLTALAIQYRDINYGMNFGVQLLMYASPVVYPATLIPEDLQLWYALNPMVGVIEGFRAALLGTREMPLDFIAIGGVVSILMFISGALYFRRKEHIFADVA
jgi:lipopolysaccharide transport system permease protein